MLQKETLTTKSFKSNTSETAVQFVKGVGPKLGAVFSSRGICTVKDLLTFFPRAYEDRTRIFRVAELKDGQPATVLLQVMGARKIPLRKSGRTILEVRCRDQTGLMTLKWFHVPRGMEARFTPGLSILATGTVKAFMSRLEMVHPETTIGDENVKKNLDQQRDFGRIVPIYTEIEGVPTRILRKILWNALEKFNGCLSEDLPEPFLRLHNLPGLAEAVRSIHFPPADLSSYNLEDLIKFNTRYHWRLIYEEFFKFEYLILRQRLNMEREKASAFGNHGGSCALADLSKELPFKLTRDQSKVINEIMTDIAIEQPMNRLVQGDVGSGKTVVALLTAGAVIAEGGQVALMAPTEILAEQHFRNSLKLFQGKICTKLLTGKTTNAERLDIQNRTASGEPLLVIGTHALLEDPVVFKNLVYVMIDEQHRFGVEQRRTLKMKGVRKDPAGMSIFPHTLVLTATPIPRTLALTAYGDLAISTIKEMPPGRSPVITKVVRGDAKISSYEKIRDELRKGHQAYFIYPLVNESEAEGFTNLRAATVEAERLSREVFPEFKVGLLHGQLSADEKSSVMDAFKKGEIQVLVSTTVVEVGVDVPNATIMSVEHSDRFGLSQLHQLRGRVGRGEKQSYCFYFAPKYSSETSGQRLEVLEETTDGFVIAEADLEIRGPGEFLGVRQAGSLPFKIAELVRDREWLLRAREDAIKLLKDDPDLVNLEHLPLRNYFLREGKIQFERLKTS